MEHRHLKVLTAVFRDDLPHHTRRENWCGLRLSDAGRRLQATNCIKQVRWWNCFLVERFASFWDLPGYWYPLCIAHMLPPLTNPWDHLEVSEKSWECHGGYPQLSSIFSDFPWNKPSIQLGIPLQGGDQPDLRRGRLLLRRPLRPAVCGAAAAQADLCEGAAARLEMCGGICRLGASWLYVGYMRGQVTKL